MFKNLIFVLILSLLVFFVRNSTSTSKNRTKRHLIYPVGGGTFKVFINLDSIRGHNANYKSMCCIVADCRAWYSNQIGHSTVDGVRYEFPVSIRFARRHRPIGETLPAYNRQVTRETSRRLRESERQKFVLHGPRGCHEQV